jgi:hypothetical protein
MTARFHFVTLLAECVPFRIEKQHAVMAAAGVKIASPTYAAVQT